MRRVLVLRHVAFEDLGAARALDAEVMPGAAGQEIGWFPLLPAPGAAASAPGYMDALLDGGAPPLHWHGDTFTLPRGAHHLASSARYPNQAFAWGRNCLALQFQPEFDRPGWNAG
jgi:GMP synthase (glutamine-hydrolysing)